MLQRFAIELLRSGMDLRTKLKIAAGKRRAQRGASNPPPIGTWERVGWDDWHGQIEWDRRVREERESQAHITTGYFTPIRTPRIRSGGRGAFASFVKIAAALSCCTSLYFAGRYVLEWL
jgi:hypothetical protein